MLFCYDSSIKANSDQHLDRYLAEFMFRWDNRKTTDMERTTSLVKSVAGKRLMYRTPIKK